MVGKKITFPLRGYMFTPFVQILWTSNQNWLHRDLLGFSIVRSTDNCPLGVNEGAKLVPLTKLLSSYEKRLKKLVQYNNSSTYTNITMIQNMWL